MTFDEYQKAAARTMNPRLPDQEKLVDAAAGIAEEAGEVLAHVRKHLYQGKELDREKLAEELGDVLWCVSGVASANGLNLGTVAERNLRKLEVRWPMASPDRRQALPWRILDERARKSRIDWYTPDDRLLLRRLVGFNGVTRAFG